jgi:uncharacterized membrane protein
MVVKGPESGHFHDHPVPLGGGGTYAAPVLDTIGGLPAHPLLVHAPVVLVPLTAIGAVLMAFSPRFSRRFGVAVTILGGVAFVSAAAAKLSGEEFAETVAVAPEHAAAGDRVPLAALVLGILVLALWLIDRGIPGNRSRPVWVVILAVVVAVVAVVAVVLTIVAGHTGAESVWLVSS